MDFTFGETKEMDTTDTYLAKLRKRYRRFFGFDRILCIFLGLSSLISLYGFFEYESNKTFHLLGAITTILIAIIGFRANQLLLKEEKKGRWLGYLATTLFVSTRISASAYSVWSIFEPFGAFKLERLWSIAPVLFVFLFFVGAYRGIYHMSAHFYVKIFIERREAEQGARYNSGQAPELWNRQGQINPET